ncbi:MAG: hypothetical protein ABI474_08850 [Actinomycetota bacterium]
MGVSLAVRVMMRPGSGPRRRCAGRGIGIGNGFECGGAGPTFVVVVTPCRFNASATSSTDAVAGTVITGVVML